MAQELLFDLTDPRLKQDPYPIFKTLRDTEPMHFSPLGFWVATRYEDIRAVLMDRTNFGQGDFLQNIRLFYGQDFDVLSHSAYRWLSEIFLYQDPPRHTRVRGLVTQALTARRISGEEFLQRRFGNQVAVGGKGFPSGELGGVGHGKKDEG